MNKLKTVLNLTLFLALALLLTACGASASTNDVKVGIIGDPESPNNAQWVYLQETLADEGITIELVSFSDYTTPNTAVAQGDLDLNAYQTKIYVGDFNESTGSHLVHIGDTTFNPLGIFSNVYASVDEIKAGDQIVIPNNATGEGRALFLLESAGLITLNADADINATIDDISENPLNLTVVPVEPNQTARSLEDAEAAIINDDMAADAGLIPAQDAIYLEEMSKETEPFINVIVANGEDEGNQIYQRIVEAYQTEAVAEIITEETNGSSLPAW